MDDLKKILKRERRRFSRRRKGIRKEMKDYFLELVERKVRELSRYLEVWCRGSPQDRKKG